MTCEWRSGIDQALIACAARWIQTCASPTPNHTESDSRLILTIRLEGEARARDRGRRREKWKLRRSAPRIHAASSTEKMQRQGEGGALTCWLATWWAKRRPAEQTNASARFQGSKVPSAVPRSSGRSTALRFPATIRWTGALIWRTAGCRRCEALVPMNAV